MADATRESYLAEWAAKLNVPKGNPWFIVEALVNDKKNYDTAVAVMFGLRWTVPEHKAWMIRCQQELAKLPTQFPGKRFDYKYLYEWACYYEKEVEAPPKQ